MTVDDDLVCAIRALAREEARSEIASLCGLVLRRTQDDHGSMTYSGLAAIIGEALRDFTTATEPGKK